MAAIAGVLDLILPLHCGGCGALETRWCPSCARQLAVGAYEPRLVSPRIDPGVPVFALGRYAGVRRRVIVAVKERGRSDLITPLSHGLRAGVNRLVSWGMIDTPLLLVPAPTRVSAARRRGGDPVASMAAAAVAGNPAAVLAAVLRTREFARDSAGLAAGARQRNVSGRILLRRRRLCRLASVGAAGVIGGLGEALLVDDVVTTGATAAESVRVLRAAGVRVAAVLAVAAA